VNTVGIGVGVLGTPPGVLREDSLDERTRLVELRRPGVVVVVVVEVVVEGGLPLESSMNGLN